MGGDLEEKLKWRRGVVKVRKEERVGDKMKNPLNVYE